MAKPAFQLSVIARLSLGLIAMMISLFLIMDMILGIIPNQEKITQENRVYLAEGLAVQLISLLETGNSRETSKILQDIAVRHTDIASIGIRQTDGYLAYQTNNHAKHWTVGVKDNATKNNLRVPLFSNNVKWADVEVSFESKQAKSFIDWLVQSKFLLMLLLGLIGTAVIYAYLRRALNYLDPTQAIPNRVNKAFDIITDGILVVDKGGHILLANDAFKNLANAQDKDLHGKKISELDIAKPLLNDTTINSVPWETSLKDNVAVTDVSLKTIDKDNMPLALLVSSVPITDDDKAARGLLVTFKNISELYKTNQKLNETLDELQLSRAKLELNNQQLQEMAYRDSLTGCLNRRAFFQQAEDLFSAAAQGNRELYCIMADIDFFKSFNDIYGHYVGDQVIQVVAKIFQTSLRPSDLICRYGGEEFCIILSDLSEEDVSEVCERMRKTIEETGNTSIRTENIKTITMSFGIASINSGANSLESLIDYADNALYISKECGRNQVTHWTSSLVN